MSHCWCCGYAARGRTKTLRQRPSDLLPHAYRCSYGVAFSQTALVEKYLSCADTRITSDTDIMTRQVLEAACNDAVFNLVAMRKSKTAIANELRPLLRSKLQSLPWLRVGIGIFKLQTASRLTDALGAVAASSTIMSTTSAMPFN